MCTLVDTSTNPALQQQRDWFQPARLTYSLVVLGDVAHLYMHRSLFLPTGLWPWFPVGAVCVIWMGALTSLAASFHVRIAALLNWICCALMLGIVASNNGFQQAACDSVIIGGAFLLIVLPTLRPTAGKWVLALYLGSIYLDSAIHKLSWPMWSRGYGLAAPMMLPNLVWVKTSWMASFPGWFWQALGFGVVAFELTFFLLCLFPWTRGIALFTGITMHLAIAVVYPIPAFGLVMVSLYVGLLPESLLSRFSIRNAIKYNIWSPSARLLTLGAVLWATAVASVYLPQSNPARWLHKAGWLAAGIASHEVFAEGAFSHYDYQIRLVRTDGTILPYSHDNLFSLDIRDRVWELWWKRTQAPNVTLTDAEAHLRAWARSARVEARPQRVFTDRIDLNLFQQNNSVPWRPIGNVENGVVHWYSPPANTSQTMGGYMDKILW
jgi:hypothetical protein